MRIAILGSQPANLGPLKSSFSSRVWATAVETHAAKTRVATARIILPILGLLRR
jgi:hypothetical protein